MAETADTSPLRGEDWWRGLHTKEKAAVLKAYFDREGLLEVFKRQERNQEIAGELGIHPSSVALQRRWYRRRTKIVEEKSGSPQERLSFLVNSLSVEARGLPVPANTGLAWWESMSAEEKHAVVRPLIEIYGLSTTQISVYLDVESRNRIAGVCDRLNKKLDKKGLPKIKRPLFVRKRYAPRKYVYLDAPAARDSTTTRGQLIGFEDPGFENFGTAHLLDAVLKKDKLASDMAALLKRLIIGDTLDDDEYAKLGMAIRQHPELLRVFEHL